MMWKFILIITIIILILIFFTIEDCLSDEFNLNTTEKDDNYFINGLHIYYDRKILRAMQEQKIRANIVERYYRKTLLSNGIENMNSEYSKDNKISKNVLAERFRGDRLPETIKIKIINMSEVKNFMQIDCIKVSEYLWANRDSEISVDDIKRYCNCEPLRVSTILFLFDRYRIIEVATRSWLGAIRSVRISATNIGDVNNS